MPADVDSSETWSAPVASFLNRLPIPTVENCAQAKTPPSTPLATRAVTSESVGQVRRGLVRTTEPHHDAWPGHLPWTRSARSRACAGADVGAVVGERRLARRGAGLQQAD